jgi:hypothetical protein
MLLGELAAMALSWAVRSAALTGSLTSISVTSGGTRGRRQRGATLMRRIAWRVRPICARLEARR